MDSFVYLFGGVNIVVLIGATWRLSSALATMNTKLDYIVSDKILMLERRVSKIEEVIDDARNNGSLDTRSV